MATLVWRNDAFGNKFSNNIINNRKFTLKAYKDGRYTCHITKVGSEAGLPYLAFEGKSLNIQKAMIVAEKEYKDYNKIPDDPPKCKTPEIVIKDNLIYIVYNLNDIARYTLNGSDVRKTHKIYRNPIPLEDKISVIKAKTFNKDKEDSDQATLTIIRN